MWGERSKEQHQRPEVVRIDCIVSGKLVSQLHQCCDCSIMFQTGNIVGHLLNRFVDQTIDVRVQNRPALLPQLTLGQSPHVLQKALQTNNSFLLPRLARIEWPHEHLIESKHINRELSYDFLRRNSIPVAFTHFPGIDNKSCTCVPVVGYASTALFAQFYFMHINIDASCIVICISRNHSLVEESVEWLAGRNLPEIVQNFVPETRVKKMKNSMFRASDIQINCPGSTLAAW